MMQIRAAIVTVSDKGYAGEREDVSGPLLADLLREIGAEVAIQAVVPDEPELIREALIRLVDDEGVDLILTTGGTGFTPRDRTPEATREAVEREAPGLAEALRLEGYRRTPLAVLSRGIAGLRGRTLIVNLPGSPRAVREGMEVLAPLLPHAIQMARGEETEHRGEGRV
jgi:molybdopterin adenylyltransferase